MREKSKKKTAKLWKLGLAIPALIRYNNTVLRLHTPGGCYALCRTEVQTGWQTHMNPVEVRTEQGGI
jgi:hypothetical protein